MHTTLDSIPQVRAFTDDIRKTGTWRGEPLEGFVIRTHITEPPTSSSRSDKATLGMLPYSPGSTFFFKVKFDEPYLMYRDWREVTKSLLSMQAKSGNMNPNSLPKSKMRRPETKVYVDWAIKEIKRNPKAFAQYQNNKGIIKTREMFLEWLASNEAAVVKEEEKPKTRPLFTKTIIVPIAIPGSGTCEQCQARLAWCSLSICRKDGGFRRAISYLWIWPYPERQCPRLQETRPSLYQERHGPIRDARCCHCRQVCIPLYIRALFFS